MYSYIIFGIIGLASTYVISALRLENKASTEQQDFKTRFAVIIERFDKILFNNTGQLVALSPQNHILYSENGNEKVVFNIYNHKLLVTWSDQYRGRDISYTQEFDYTTKNTIFKQEKWVNKLLLKLSDLREDFEFEVLTKTTQDSRANISSIKHKNQWQKYY